MIVQRTRMMALGAAALLFFAASLVAVPRASAEPPAPTVSLTPAASGGVVNAMTITFTVAWAAGWDGSVLSNELSATSGHVHFMIDGNPPAMHFADAGATSSQRTFTFDLGIHTVAVELVNPNHMPYSPSALSQATFEVALSEESRLILDQVQTVSGGLGTLTLLVYGVLILSVVSVAVGAVAIAQARSIRRPPSS